MSKTSIIIEIMQDYINGSSNNEPQDPNHWVRRFFRCFIDGSYLGEAHYKSNIAYITTNKDNTKKMTSFVINQFVQFITKEFDCTYSTAQRAIIKALTASQLAELNTQLIDDSLDLLN